MLATAAGRMRGVDWVIFLLLEGSCSGVAAGHAGAFGACLPAFVAVLP
ncbi:hypothetical protein [Accumulibacter sp.]|nr:hypothetical protein [Accumulibacter sp.]HPU80683.1 hypothetical protein [Accumulibacter sp.]